MQHPKRMRLSRITKDAAGFLVLLLGCLAPYQASGAAGFRTIEVSARANTPAIAGAMWYPCNEPAGEINLGRITLAAVKDGPIHGDQLPLVVISHGNLGDFFDHHDTAAALADAGFIVAAVSHRGDNFPNLADAADPAVMLERPDAITRLIDFMLTESPVASRIDPNRIGFFGFSAGAATGLVLAGADWDWAAVLSRFSRNPLVSANTLRGHLRSESNAMDSRIKVAVLADPPGQWIVAESISKVRIPVQLWASANGGRGLPNIAVTRENVEAVEERLPSAHEYHVVPNAGHFAFMLCGPSISPVPEFCVDAPGFDRVAFHAEFNAELIKFLRANLGERQRRVAAGPIRGDR
jgi:predicted dienelactone hydrolase